MRHVPITRVLLALVVALVAVLGSSALADDLTDARQHYAVGAAAFERGDYDSADVEFLAAWKLSHRAVILFDLARVETRRGNEEQAIAYLRQYMVEAPDAVDVISVQTEVEAREKALTERRARLAAEAVATAAKNDVEALRVADDDQARTRERTAHARMQMAGWSLLAVGLGVAVGGIACGVVAERDSATVQNGGAKTPGAAPTPFSGSFSSAAHQGTLTSPLGIALDAVGGAVAASGVALVLWSHRHPARVRAWLVPSPSGARVIGAF